MLKSGLPALLLGTMLFLVAAGCDSTEPAQTESSLSTRTTAEEDTAPATLRLTEADNGGTFEVRVGGTIEVSLKADPSTGHSWELDDPDPEASLLQQVEEPVFAPDDPQTAEGPGTLTYTLRAADKGEMVVKFVYLDPEVGESPTKTFRIDLVVR